MSDVTSYFFPPLEIETPSSDLAYVHNQASPETVWTVTHNLGFFPNLTVIDSGGNEVDGDIEHVSVNQVVITFTAAFGGTAYLS